jgi:branched-chain amino acid transport system substrate-binding protein
MLRTYVLALTCAGALHAPVAASAQATIKIGFPMPLSGPAAVYGVPILKGAEMAVEEINTKGGVLGKSWNCCRAPPRPAPTRRCASPAS